MENIKKILKVTKRDPRAKIPKYATEGAACFDLHSLTKGVVIDGKSLVCSTGLAFEIPPGWAMEIYSRSGHGFNDDVRLANCVGIIDSDYRGELKVKLTGDTGKMFEVKVGDRIAQAKLVKVEQWEIIEFDSLSDTKRGTGGFGSTGSA